MQFQDKVEEAVQLIIKATSDEVAVVRERQVSEIPRYALNSEHCEGAKLVSNRAELIAKMPSNAIVAELGADQGDFSDQILQLTNPKNLVIVDAWHTERYGDDKAASVSHRFNRQVDAGQLEIVRSLCRSF